MVVGVAGDRETTTPINDPRIWETAAAVDFRLPK
jgi:hypothetical protein